MKNRYLILKSMYPKFWVLIKRSEKYFTFNNDKLLWIYFKNKNLNSLKINYLVLENLEIIKKKEYNENKYEEYLLRAYLIKKVREIVLK